MSPLVCVNAKKTAAKPLHFIPNLREEEQRNLQNKGCSIGGRGDGRARDTSIRGSQGTPLPQPLPVGRLVPVDGEGGEAPAGRVGPLEKLRPRFPNWEGEAPAEPPNAGTTNCDAA
jgi:hypothetical protein